MIMDLSKYEAASFYDFAHHSYSSEKDYLVFDLDDSSCGYCTCNGKTDIRLNESWTANNDNLWSVLIESIKKIAVNSHLIDFEGEVERQLIPANEAFHNYFLSGKKVNGEAFSFSNVIISCKELEEGLSVLKEILYNLLSRAKNMVTAPKLLDVNIIVLGKAQELFLAMYYLREQLSFDPMLPDERFRNTEFKDPYAEIVKNGKALFESMTALKHTYSLLAFNPDSNSFDTIYTVSKKDTKMNAEELEFSEPIFLCDGETISVKADDSVLDISLPYTITPLKSDLIEVAIGLSNNEDTLYIRRSRFPTRIYEVKLS